VFTALSRVQLAHKSRLDCTSAAHHRAAGRHANVASLAAANALGMAYSNFIMAGAARCNKLAELQYLHKQGCPWLAWLLDEGTADGNFELVRWCHEHGCPWDAANKTSYYAAQSGSVELMAWVFSNQMLG
jgi:hypothetical protein